MDSLITLTLAAVIVWAAICALVFQRDPRNPLNRSFLVLGMCTCAWGAGIILRYTARDEFAARAFFNVAMFGAIMTISFLFRFVVCFIDSASENPLGRRVSAVLQAAVFAAGFALSGMLAFSQLGAARFTVHEARVSVETGPLFLVAVSWAMAVGLFSAALILYFRAGMVKDRLRKQANLILAAMTVSIVSSGVLEIGFQATSRMHFLGDPFFATVVFGLMMAFGTVRYGLMSVTPETAANQVLESLPESVFLIDTFGKVISANRTFYALSGKSKTEVEGGPVWRHFMAQGDGDPNASRINFSSTKRTDFRLDLVTASSERIPVNVATKPILDPHGERVGSIMLLTDMRQAQKIEAELISAEKLAGLGQLVAGVAHEINNPMTTVMGLSELGKKKFESEPSGAFFRQIFEQSVRIRDIVSHLLLFARKSPESVAKADISKTLDESSEIVRMGVKSADVKIEKHYPREGVTVFCEEGKIRQVFVNVLRNAFDAIAQTGRKGTVAIKAETDGRWARVEISDDGCGMDPYVQSRMFNPFFTTKEVGKGTGLGLSISHGIVEAHGGKISAQSEKGRGTNIVIELPVEGVGRPSAIQ